MSDAKLPAEGEVVLVQRPGRAFPIFAKMVGGRIAFSLCGERFGTPIALDDAPIEWWCSIPHAKAAGRLAEALRAVANGDVPGVSIGPRQREWANEVLREIGT